MKNRKRVTHTFHRVASADRMIRVYVLYTTCMIQAECPLSSYMKRMDRHFLCTENEGPGACIVAAHKEGTSWDPLACQNAAMMGHLECLRYAHEHGAPWNIHTCSYAADGGHIECLRYARRIHGATSKAAIGCQGVVGRLANP